MDRLVHTHAVCALVDARAWLAQHRTLHVPCTGKIRSVVCPARAMMPCSGKHRMPCSSNVRVRTCVHECFSRGNGRLSQSEQIAPLQWHQDVSSAPRSPIRHSFKHLVQRQGAQLCCVQAESRTSCTTTHERTRTEDHHVSLRPAVETRSMAVFFKYDGASLWAWR